MQVSFAPDGRWFVFDQDSGKTLRRNFRTARIAFDWIHQERIRAGLKSQPSQGVLNGNH